MSFSYLVAGTSLLSNVSLPELLPSDLRDSELFFNLLSPDSLEFNRLYQPAPSDWFHFWRFPDGKIWLKFGKVKGGYLLSFPNLAEFFVSVSKGLILCSPGTNVPAKTVRHLLLDQVVPLILSRKNQIILHASAVKWKGKAFLFCAESGGGKSLLAFTLARAGLSLLTDDFSVIRKSDGLFTIIPSYPSSRLHPYDVPPDFNTSALKETAHYTYKKQIDLREKPSLINYSSKPTQIETIFILKPKEPGANLSCHFISKRQAFTEILKLRFQLDVYDKKSTSELFKGIADLADSIPVKELSYPKERASLERIREILF